jgi:hypothetical protein
MFVHNHCCSRNQYYYVFWVYVNSFYPACNAHAPHCNLWPSRLYIIHEHHLTTARIRKEKKSYWTWNVRFDFLYKFVWNISHSKNTWAGYDKSVYWSSCNVPLFLSELIETWISSEDFLKMLRLSNVAKIRPLLFHVGRRTDRHDKANSRLSWFTNAPKKQHILCIGL